MRKRTRVFSMLVSLIMAVSIAVPVNAQGELPLQQQTNEEEFAVNDTESDILQKNEGGGRKKIRILSLRKKCRNQGSRKIKMISL